jgi:hypothetical protein
MSNDELLSALSIAQSDLDLERGRISAQELQISALSKCLSAQCNWGIEARKTMRELIAFIENQTMEQPTVSGRALTLVASAKKVIAAGCRVSARA